MPATILVVEDEPAIQELISAALQHAGHRVMRADSAEDAVPLVSATLPDVVLLDWMLPGMSGVQFAKRLRGEERTRDLPIIMLTARGEEQDKVAGLDAGADDYLGKPFQTAEVVARLRALVRRSAGDASPILVHEDVRLDVTGGAATLEGRPVDLTARELRILGYLMHRQGRIVSQAELMDHVYALDDIRESNTIEVYVGRLRKKLGKDCIRTIRGLGYRVG